MSINCPPQKYSTRFESQLNCRNFLVRISIENIPNIHPKAVMWLWYLARVSGMRKLGRNFRHATHRLVCDLLPRSVSFFPRRRFLRDYGYITSKLVYYQSPIEFETPNRVNWMIKLWRTKDQTWKVFEFNRVRRQSRFIQTRCTMYIVQETMAYRWCPHHERNLTIVTVLFV